MIVLFIYRIYPAGPIMTYTGNNNSNPIKQLADDKDDWYRPLQVPLIV